MQGLQRPPAWATVALIALTVGNAALFAYLFWLGPTPAVTPERTESTTAAVATPRPTPAPVEPPEADRPAVLAVYGDGYSAGSTYGGQGAQGWPALVAKALDMELRLHAVSMAGYVSSGVTGQSYPQLVAAAPEPDATVVIVFGSRNDASRSAADVEQAAATTLSTIRASSRAAEIVLIGPAWSSASFPSGLTDVGAAVQRAAIAAGAAYVDPVAGGWFTTPDGLIAPDGISPTDAGHAYLAELITPAVRPALDADPQPAG